MANVETQNGLRLLVVEDQKVLLQSLQRGLNCGRLFRIGNFHRHRRLSPRFDRTA